MNRKLLYLLMASTSIVFSGQVIDSDKIIVLTEQGGLAEGGTHQELIKNNGYYASLWEQTKRLLGQKTTVGV